MTVVQTFNTLFIQPSEDSIRKEIQKKYLFMFILMVLILAAALGIAWVDGEISGDIVLSVLVPGIIVFAAVKHGIIPPIEQKALLINRRSKGVQINGMFLPVSDGKICGFKIKGNNFRFEQSKEIYVSDALRFYPDLETVLKRWLTARENELPTGELGNITYSHVTVLGIFQYAFNILRDKLKYSEEFHTLHEKEQERIKERYRKRALWYLSLINGIPLLLVNIGVALYLPFKDIFDSFQQGLIWFIFGFYFFIFQSYSLLLLPPLHRYLRHSEDRYTQKNRQQL